MTALLDVADLRVRFATPRGTVPAVQGVSFTVRPGEILGIVGESGSGKSQILFSLMGLLPANGAASGSVRFEGQEMLGLSAAQLNRLRGDRLALVFQDPMTALNPYLTVERQLSEVLTCHRRMSRRAARAEALAVLRRVHLAEPEAALDRYPHQLSGGMRQRVVIAMAMIGNPSLLLADEPTTALDVTIQAEILDLLAEQRQAGIAIILVTHDMGVVARLCDRVLVMYAGAIVEAGDTADIFHRARHPYTQALLAAMPRIDDDDAGLARPIEGQPPDLLALPSGCTFWPRCPVAVAACRQTPPPLLPLATGGAVACHLEGR